VHSAANTENIITQVFDCAKQKTMFTLNLYARYRRNLQDKKLTIMSMPFNCREEKGLLLKEIDENKYFKQLTAIRLLDETKCQENGLILAPMA
jgi:hypothetical protein